jgi:putrescine transport system substrate-binding protein
MLRPDIAALNSSFVGYANAVPSARDKIDPAVRNDPGIYPPPDVKARLQPNLAKSADFTRALNRSWTRFTTGR